MSQDQNTTASLLQQAAAAVEAAKAAGASDAWAGAGTSRQVEFSVRDGALEKVSEATTSSMALELWVDGRYSTHRTTDLRPESLARFAREAVALTRHLQPDPFRSIPDPALFEGRSDVDLDLVDPTVAALTREDREALCRAQNEQLAGQDGVVSATSGTSDGHGVSVSVSSNGFSGSHEHTWLWLGSELTMKQDDGLTEAWMWGGGPHRAQAPTPDAVAAETLKRARDREGSAKGPTRKGLMIVDPSAAASLVRRLLGPASGRSVQQGQSFWADRMDQPLLSDKLTIFDDPLLPRGLSSRHFDGEGIASRRLPIVDQGRLVNLYLDTYYARKLDRAPTTGGSSNVVVQPGRRDLAGIVADADQAIYVTSWLGGNADGTTGDFSFGMRGHLVQDGRIGAPVGEMNVTGNLLSLFASLVEVGNDPWPYSGTLAPTLVFDGVDFSGA